MIFFVKKGKSQTIFGKLSFCKKNKIKISTGFLFRGEKTKSQLFRKKSDKMLLERKLSSMDVS